MPASTEPRIAVANLYYLLCYAYDALEEVDQVDVESMPEAELADLFANVLGAGIERLARRGLDRGYVEYQGEGRTVRGTIDFPASVSRLLFQNAKVWRRHTDLSIDVLPNQILRATVGYVHAMSRIGVGPSERLATASAWLDGVSDVPISSASFRRVQIHAGNRLYRFLLDVCELIYRTLMVAPGGEDCSFSEFVRDELRMRGLWERFLRGFFTRHMAGYDVGPRRFNWIAAPAPGLLPMLSTDVTLVGGLRTVILDAKYTPNVLAYGPHGTGRLRPDHVNQVFAYASNIPTTGSRVHAGLVYPLFDCPLNERFELPSCKLWAWTVDLSRDWQHVRGRLLEIIRDVEESDERCPDGDQTQP